jgi:diguanylate cyclase (GGDEF)-like protein
MVTSLNMKERQTLEPAQCSMAHIITVLQGTWDFAAWLFLTVDPSGKEWTVSHVKTSHAYKIQIGDTLIAKREEVFPLEDGFHNHAEPEELRIKTPRVSGIGPIGAHILHVIHGVNGEICGALLGVSPENLKSEFRQALPILSLLSDMYVKTHCALMDILLEQRRSDNAIELANVDSLTTLCNRRGWNQAVESERARLLRHGGDCCLVVIDIDEFKSVNDKYGHARGDEILSQVAKTIKSQIRKEDVSSRIGGDEFGIILCESNLKGATALAKNIQRDLASTGVRISVGIERVKSPSYDFDAAFRSADQKMYKNKGRLKDAFS